MEDFDQTADDSAMQSNINSRNKTRRSSVSLFDLVIEVVPSGKTRKTEYEDNLLRESKDWNELLKGKVLDAERAEKTNLEIDKSVLSATQRAYLERAPDLNKFIEGSEEFRAKSESYFLENNDIVEMHNQFIKYCKAHLAQISADTIYDCIYSYKPLSS